MTFPRIFYQFSKGLSKDNIAKPHLTKLCSHKHISRFFLKIGYKKKSFAPSESEKLLCRLGVCGMGGH